VGGDLGKSSNGHVSSTFKRYGSEIQAQCKYWHGGRLVNKAKGSGKARAKCPIVHISKSEHDRTSPRARAFCGRRTTVPY